MDAVTIWVVGIPYSKGCAKGNNYLKSMGYGFSTTAVVALCNIHRHCVQPVSAWGLGSYRGVFDHPLARHVPVWSTCRGDAVNERHRVANLTWMEVSTGSANFGHWQVATENSSDIALKRWPVLLCKLSKNSDSIVR